ncbi:MAG: tetrahydromethanopterin S-methyltransferase subunit H [Chloroflexota bacterium]
MTAAAAAPREVQLGEATIGGPFGATTGLLVGSIFYDGHSVVHDALAGTFDEARAAVLVERLDAARLRYGVQMALDVIAASSMAMERYLEFLAPRTGVPLLINATEPEVRVAGLVAADRLGILGRAVYASLTEDADDTELEALAAHRPAAVMVLACDVTDPTPDGTCRMLDEVLLPKAASLGLGSPIVDVGVMDPPSIGLALRSIEAVRARYGYPVGCAFANAFPQWSAVRAMGRPWTDLSLAAALVATRAAGADFLHFGIVERAPVAAHAAATAEVFYGYAAREVDGRTLPPEHPIRAMFRPVPRP